MTRAQSWFADALMMVLNPVHVRWNHLEEAVGTCPPKVMVVWVDLGFLDPDGPSKRDTGIF